MDEYPSLILLNAMGIVHHRKSIRLPEYDYTQPGAYFVTVVTACRAFLFGEIMDGEMRLSRMGEIVQREWNRLPYRFENVEIDEYAIMPDHFHAVLIINDHRSRGTGEELPRALTITGIQHPHAPTTERFGKPIPGSIPTIIRSFKSSVTYQARKFNNHEHGIIWQRNYYERVIRDEKELDRIRTYIINNPSNWSRDPENR